jgi:hypothetical protein
LRITSARPPKSPLILTPYQRWIQDESRLKRRNS